MLGTFQYRISFEAHHEITVLFGHSGAGKSVSLQIAAGLLRPDRGRVVINGRTVLDTSAGVFVPPQQRHLGYVVQNLALFPNMSVADNIRFGMPRGIDQRKRLNELLELLSLEGYEERAPGTLSGGQQQRVALARALARDAGLLLLDEPFSALDERLRAGLRQELLRLRRDLGLTIVFVTHDLREAHLLANRIAVLDEGQVLQFSARDHVFKRPASRRVAELTGVENLLPVEVVARDGETALVDVAGARFQCASVVEGLQPLTAAFAGIRAERVNMRRHHDEVPPNHMRGRITDEWSYGNTHTLRFEPIGPGPSLTVELASRPYEVLDVAQQREWLLELPAEDLHLMPA